MYVHYTHIHTHLCTNHTELNAYDLSIMVSKYVSHPVIAVKGPENVNAVL